MPVVPMRNDWNPNATTPGHVPMRNNWLPSTSLPGTPQSAPLPTPYLPQNNAPMGAMQSAMRPHSSFMPPQSMGARPMPQSQLPMQQPNNQMGALGNPQLQQRLMAWFQQQMPMWRQAQQQTMMQQPMQPTGALNMYSNRYIG